MSFKKLILDFKPYVLLDLLKFYTYIQYVGFDVIE